MTSSAASLPVIVFSDEPAWEAGGFLCAARFLGLGAEVEAFTPARTGGRITDSLLTNGVGLGSGGRSAREEDRVLSIDCGRGNGSSLLGGI